MKQRLIRACLCLIAATWLASCQDMFNRAAAPERAAPSAASEAAPSPPAGKLIEVSPLPAQGQAGAHQDAQPAAQIFHGTGAFVGRVRQSKAAATESAEGDITLNFVNADVRDVAKTVLGDLLKLDYLVAGSVQGTLTIQTSRPLDRASVLPIFEESLRIGGLALVRSKSVYKIVLAAEAPRENSSLVTGAAMPSAAAGFGIRIVPLRYVSAPEMQHLLEPMAPTGSILRVDPVRNILILGGTQQELAAMLEEVAVFDVDWLAGMSFGLFPLKAADAKTMAADLEKLIGGRESPLAGLVRIVPIARMNAILAISPQARYLDELKPWVERLDQANRAADQRIYVYYVQNGRAADLAAVLTKILSSGGRGASPGSRSVEVPEMGGPVVEPVQAQAQTQARARTQAPYTIVQPEPPVPAGREPIASEALPGASEEGAPRAPDGLAANALAGVRITADESNNALLFLATPVQFQVIEAALQKLDIAPLQVLLEAAVAEVTLSNELRYGVQYFFKFSGSRVSLTESATSAIVPDFPGFGYILSSGSKIKAILSALEGVTDVNVVSAPELLVLNNQTATLQVGDQVPVATQSAVSVLTPGAPIVNSIQFKDTGVILKVTPRVNEGGLVTMDVSQEVSDVATTTTSQLNSPTIQQRKITSTIAVQDGETIALGGLIRDKRSNSRNGFPFLQDIPYVGAIFGATDDKVTRTELLVLLTPHVVQGVQKLRSVTDELRRKLPKARKLLEGTNPNDARPKLR